MALSSSGSPLVPPQRGGLAKKRRPPAATRVTKAGPKSKKGGK